MRAETSESSTCLQEVLIIAILSVICIVQNLFHQGKGSRLHSLNSHYLVLFKNPRDKLQILTLAKQMYPGQTDFFIKRYEEALRRPFGYLLVDLKTTTQDNCRLRTNVLPGEERFDNVGVTDNISQELLKYIKKQNLATAPVLPAMQKLQDSMDGLLSRTDLGEYERTRQYMQLQNKYLTFKHYSWIRDAQDQVYLTLKSNEKCLVIFWQIMYPHPFKSRWQSQWTQFKNQWLMYKRSLFKNYQYKRPPFKSPVSLQATPAKVLPPSSILTPPPTGEAPSQGKRKRPRIRFVNYLEDLRSRRSQRLRLSSLLYLPSLIIRPSGFAIEFEYGIRPLTKPMIFKQFTFAFDVFDIRANPLAARLLAEYYETK